MMKTRCEILLDIATSVKGICPCKNELWCIREAIEVVACCRSMRRNDLASSLISSIEKLPLSELEEVKNELNREKQKISAGEVDAIEEKKLTKLPPIIIRGWNFAVAMARYATSGFATCNQEEIDGRLSICLACPNMVDNHCLVCGCGCNSENSIINKLALKSESCPQKKW